MAKIPAFLLKIFGGSLAAPGNIAVFGSTAAGAPAYSLDPVAIQTARYLQGWAGGIVGDGSPVMQDRNAMDYLLTLFSALVQQEGLIPWQVNVTYYMNSWVKDPTTGMQYRSLIDNNFAQALANTNAWQSLADYLVGKVVPTAALCKAWVLFDGFSANILAGFNVDTVVRNSVGVYTLNFGVPMTNAEYAWAGSCGAQNGGGPTAGNNNIIIGGGAQLPGSLRIINWESTGGPIGPEDGQRICVQVFGN